MPLEIRKITPKSEAPQLKAEFLALQLCTLTTSARFRRLNPKRWKPAERQWVEVEAPVPLVSEQFSLFPIK